MLSPLPVRERMKVRVLITARDFFARASRFRLRSFCLRPTLPYGRIIRVRIPNCVGTISYA
jgi:hypothetical protein